MRLKRLLFSKKYQLGFLTLEISIYFASKGLAIASIETAHVVFPLSGLSGFLLSDLLLIR